MKIRLMTALLCGVIVTTLVGCSIDEPYPAKGNRCFVRDRHGRLWSASSFHNACHHALQKCNHWHYQHGIRHYRCEVE